MLFSSFSLGKSAKFANITDPRKHLVIVSTVHIYPFANEGVHLYAFTN